MSNANEVDESTSGDIPSFGRFRTWRFRAVKKGTRRPAELHHLFLEGPNSEAAGLECTIVRLPWCS